MKIARIGLLIPDVVLLFYGATTLFAYFAITRAFAKPLPLNQDTLQIYSDTIHECEQGLLICAILMLAAGMFHILFRGKSAA